ncbi:hypothetical protein [Actinomycetospora atypica]|uniref:Uncharacterized protein n=1 Tax=Actinomycetospora atypica TaxID=1290095 RepID=A0ABV9YK50_9PSEU
MSTPGRPDVAVDLVLEVTDAAGRRTSGHLVGSGEHVRMTVTDPAVVVAAAGRGAGHSFADRLADAGVRAELHGPRGRVATIDPARTSRLGSLVTGSSHVVLDRSAWTLAARTRLPSARGLALGAAAAVVVIAALRWRSGARTGA